MTCIIDKTIRFVKFQLTRSRGAWPLEYSDSRGQTGNFNSHAHVERDLICLKSQKIIIHISTHTLTWSVTRFVNTAEVYLQFQLTRSRGAWPQKNSPKAVIKIISTHTLTWSVTTAVLQLVRITKISTHTLTWSVTFVKKFCKKCLRISTHTLTWSVTEGVQWNDRWWKFQLTRSRGAWPTFKR